jgi:hypothetical protein
LRKASQVIQLTVDRCLQRLPLLGIGDELICRGEMALPQRVDSALASRAIAVLGTRRNLEERVSDTTHR